MTSTVQDFQGGWELGWNDTDVAVIAAEGAFPFPISIDGRGYVMDLAKYERNTLAQFRQQSDTSREPGEQSLAIEGVWKRTGVSSYLGAGQRFYDDDDSDRHRFYRSKGIDPWTKRELRLLHGTELVHVSAALTQHVLKVGDLMVFAHGDTMIATDDPRNPSATWTDQALGSATNITSIASNGVKLYCACGASGLRTVVPGTPGGALLVSPGTMAPTLVIYANGWLLAGQGPRLASIGSTGTPTDVMVHPNASLQWVCGAASPNGIYIGANSGDKSEIYRTTVNDAGSALQVPVFAGDLPAGETIHTMEYYSGLMLIGTSRGLRKATIQSDGGLSIGAVIVDGSGQGVRCFESRGRYAWFGFVNDYDGNHRGLARADLARDVEENVPAYAADLASTVDTGRTVSVATWVEGGEEYRLFCVSGSGLWAEADELVETGTIDLGWLGQGSPEPKSLQSVSISHEALVGSIFLTLTNERGAEAEASSEEPGTWVSGEMARTLLGELFGVAITLNRSVDDPTLGPVVWRWTMRVVPAPASVEEIIVPILMADDVRDDGLAKRYAYDTFAEFRILKTLENERRVVTYREGQASYRVTVRGVAIQGANKWSKDRRFLESTLMVRLLTLDGVPPELGGI